LEEERRGLEAERREVERLREDYAAADRERKNMQKEMAALQARLEKKDRGGSRELQQAQRDLEKAERLIKEAQAREEQLKAELQRARAAGGNDWDAPVPVGGAVPVARQPSASGAERRVRDLENTIKQLEREKAESAATLSGLQKKLNDAERAARRKPADTAVPERDGMEAENRKLTVELARAQDRVEALQAQLASRKEDERVYSEMIEDTDARWSQDNLRLKQELNRERSNALELQETVKLLRASLDKAERERLELLQEQKERIPAVEDARNRYEAQNADLQRKLNQTMQELAGMKRKTLDQADALSRQTAQNRTLAEKLDALQADYLKLANSSAVTASENVSAQSEMDRMKNEMEGLRREVQEMDRYAEQLQLAGRQVEALQAELADRDLALNKLQAERHAADREMEALRQTQSSLELAQLEKVEWNQTKEQLQARVDDMLAEKMDLEWRWPGWLRKKAMPKSWQQK